MGMVIRGGGRIFSTGGLGFADREAIQQKRGHLSGQKDTVFRLKILRHIKFFSNERGTAPPAPLWRQPWWSLKFWKSYLTVCLGKTMFFEVKMKGETPFSRNGKKRSGPCEGKLHHSIKIY